MLLTGCKFCNAKHKLWAWPLSLFINSILCPKYNTGEHFKKSLQGKYWMGCYGDKSQESNWQLHLSGSVWLMPNSMYCVLIEPSSRFIRFINVPTKLLECSSQSQTRWNIYSVLQGLRTGKTTLYCTHAAHPSYSHPWIPQYIRNGARTPNQNVLMLTCCKEKLVSKAFRPHLQGNGKKVVWKTLLGGTRSKGPGLSGAGGAQTPRAQHRVEAKGHGCSSSSSASHFVPPSQEDKLTPYEGAPPLCPGMPTPLFQGPDFQARVIFFQ